MLVVKQGLPEGGRARREWASKIIQAAEDAAEAASIEPQHLDARDKADLVKASCPEHTLVISSHELYVMLITMVLI